MSGKPSPRSDHPSPLSDDERAKKIRSELEGAVAPICKIMADAANDGFIVNFSVGQQDGVHKLLGLNITKELLKA